MLYNSKIGLGPEKLHDGNEQLPQLGQLARLLDRMSIVVIRIRNTGSYDIDSDDFDRSLSFTFGRRIVWNARVSEAGSPEVHEQLRASLQFFRTDAAAKERQVRPLRAEARRRSSTPQRRGIPALYDS